ncbi:MAG: hypothetical protein MJ066_05550 [Clostridia bacterium]|nr:hypothetical protein [Clostridia bacterium]
MNTKESLARLKTIITDLTSFYGELSEELYKLHFVKDGVSDTEKIIPFPIKENGNTLQGENMLTVSKFNIRRRQHKNSIEARCNYAGRSISISAPTEKELKSKLKKYCEDFNKKLKLAVAPAPMKQEQTEKGVVLPGFGTSGDVSFKEYALQYLEQVKKDDVSYDWYLK